eukprot:TRINITY_DN842_c0_g2_i15.p1 TRINITY_DN842_c0_g2~~TRINITY_DN842_c0_g2_i15.p1  ORF type:complete len:265 (+),score=55.51 TRINITY_DN842_c0_g2_i15:70-864(+)
MQMRIKQWYQRRVRELHMEPADLPPGYDVSTSCGRVYKNRVERPWRYGANRSKTTGPTELELETGVKGLFLIYNFLTEDEENEMVNSLVDLEWDSNRAGTRRVQLYVPWKEEKYRIVPKDTILPMPDTAKRCGYKIIEWAKQQTVPELKRFDWSGYLIYEDQMTELQINEYNAKDVLGFHKDNPTAYKEVIFGISLLADCEISYQNHREEIRVLIPRRSLYILSGEARSKWKHGILPGGIMAAEDGKRISLTYRCVEYTRNLKK